MDPKRLAIIDEKLHFNNWGNAEVATEWYVLGINSNYTEIRPDIERFISKVGRRKFLLPIYTALNNNPESKNWGLEVYMHARNNYHPVSIMTLDDLLDYKP
jgi:leukotriene-A4 hydrolase